MEKSLLKDSVRQIKNTFKRFLSIVAIVLLGVGFFAGITATSPDMKDTVDTYFDDEDVMDIEVISTLGLTDEDIEALKQVDGTKDVVGTYSIDATFSTDKKEYVVKIESMPDMINNVILKEGSLPQNADECVVESSLITMTGYKIGDYIILNPQKIESSTSLGDIDISNDEVIILGEYDNVLYYLLKNKVYKYEPMKNIKQVLFENELEFNNTNMIFVYNE